MAFYENLGEGDRVWAPWNNTNLFAGTVIQVRNQETHIHFDDGDKGWVLIEQVFPLEIQVGLRVLGRWRQGVHYYSGTVAEVRGQRIHLHYDDGDKEWTTSAYLMIPCQPNGPHARPTKHAIHLFRGGAGWLIPLGLGLLFVLVRVACR